MRISALVLLSLVILTGCAGKALDDLSAIESAGVTQYRDEVVILEGDQRAERSHTFVSGKELGLVEVEFGIDPASGRVIQAKLRASDVRAFEGQAIAASAAINVQAELVKLGIEVTEAMREAIALGIRAALGGGIP